MGQIQDREQIKTLSDGNEKLRIALYETLEIIAETLDITRAREAQISAIGDAERIGAD